ncbi:transposase [Streptomyces sp. NBC_00237]|uniref:transposase n=1 Tax=Streptomyces sp. NBC_00237 TaxID=2975687 RepID=UPI00338D4681
MELFCLPPYSPELNDIELVWRQANDEDYPRRSQTSTDSLGEAVDQAMTQRRERIRGPANTFTSSALSGNFLRFNGKPYSCPSIQLPGAAGSSLTRYSRQVA